VRCQFLLIGFVRIDHVAYGLKTRDCRNMIEFAAEQFEVAAQFLAVDVAIADELCRVDLFKAIDRR